MMRGRFIAVLGLMLVCPYVALGADPVVVTPAAERLDATTPAVVPPAQVVIEKPKPVEKPRPPIIKEVPKEVPPPKEVSSKTIVSPVPAVEPVPVPADKDTAKPAEAKTGYPISCFGLAFAMLITGIAAGFLWRHLMSRHKLGGMSVRIGTWRGIP